MNNYILKTVSIGIPAFNEAENICKTVKSCLKQRLQGFEIEEIIVTSDGSTDSTVDHARSCDSELVKVIDNKERKGKPARLNEIYAMVESDILVLLDADVEFENERGLQELVTALTSTENVMMSSSYIQPLPGKTFIEKAINCSMEAYNRAVAKYKDGNIVLTVSGRALAYKKPLYKKLSIPANMISDDKYSYLICEKEGYEYRYAKKSVVLYRSPMNFKDHIGQNTRYVSDRPLMEQYFKVDKLKELYYFPGDILRKELLKEFFDHPILSTTILVTNFYCKLRGKVIGKNLYEAKWSEVVSSKELN